MARKSRGPPRKGLWAYAYDITLPARDDGLQAIQDLLDEESAEAKDGARTWAGRVVIEPQITRILVVSDSPDQKRDVNRRLEAEMKQMKATFEITVPMVVTDDVASGPMNGQPPADAS